MAAGVVGQAGAARAQDGADVEAVVVVGRDYRVTTVGSATKTATASLQIPQPIQVVTRQLIEDQRPLTISDALRNVSGFSALRNSGEVFRSFNIRGFQTLDLNVDGLRQTFGLSGDFGRVFHGEGVNFDADAGHFELSRPSRRSVRLAGAGPRRLWTLRALERCGIGVDPTAATGVNVEAEGWTTECSGETVHADSLYELLADLADGLEGLAPDRPSPVPPR